ncbi:Hypp6774 [Branchiostoma lanceolatum]|uniref:Hypp6774 protein n=1 Tax=Branchiostoma lanceolatum TaxID=7740 RepID=A0A8J9YVI7_BRALA|nr:Hypp6774 [Branchiostoma lanceolatum]
MKTHIRRYVNEKHDVISAEDMKEALESHGGVKECRVAVAQLAPGRKPPENWKDGKEPAKEADNGRGPANGNGPASVAPSLSEDGVRADNFLLRRGLDHGQLITAKLIDFGCAYWETYPVCFDVGEGASNHIAPEVAEGRTCDDQHPCLQPGQTSGLRLQAGQQRGSQYLLGHDVSRRRGKNCQDMSDVKRTIRSIEIAHSPGYNTDNRRQHTRIKGDDTSSPSHSRPGQEYNSWFCRSIRESCKVRFNIIFECAAGVYYHKEDIQNMFQVGHHKTGNRLLRAVLADITSPPLLATIPTSARKTRGKDKKMYDDRDNNIKEVKKEVLKQRGEETERQKRKAVQVETERRELLA